MIIQQYCCPGCGKDQGWSYVPFTKDVRFFCNYKCIRTYVFRELEK